MKLPASINNAALLRSLRAFSLIELLVVMAIIGLLAGIGIPALKGLGGSNDISAATRQLLDDLAYARAKAINDRTTVYVAFVSENILRQPWSATQRKEVSKRANLQYTSYALYAKRSLGDQPGPGRARFITDWRTLPQGIFFTTNKFDYAMDPRRLEQPLALRTLKHELIPFPTPADTAIPMPCITFDYQGRLRQSDDAVLLISKGSIIYPQERNDPNLLASPEIIETPKNNYTNNPAVRVDYLTGRARMELPENVDYARLYYPMP